MRGWTGVFLVALVGAAAYAAWTWWSNLPSEAVRDPEVDPGRLELARTAGLKQPRYGYG